MSLDVADLVASLTLNSAGFLSGMAAAETRAKLGAGNIKLAFGAIGIAAAGAIADMTKKAADFQSMTQTLANNTNMGAKGLDQMRAGVLQLAQQTGQPLESLANGWMHIANHAYDGAAAMNIATAAAKNAAATGGDAGDNMNILAGVMREYGVTTRQAATNTQLATRYMDVLHNAVAQSNYTMLDFVEGSKRAIATAGLFKVPLADVSAQLALLSEHGFPSARVAALNWAGMLRSLEAPTKKGADAMSVLGRRAGVDLIADIQKLHQNGAFLPQFLADITKASQGGDFNLIRQMMPQSSYATALAALIKFRGELQRIQATTSAAQAGQMLPGMTGTNEAFLAWSKTVNGQLTIMRGAFDVLSVRIGSVFLPVLNKLLTAAAPIVSRIADWVAKNPQLTATILGVAAVVGTLVGGLTALEFAIGPVVAAIELMSAPVLGVVAAVAALALAWQNDWGGIREKTAAVWAALQPIFKAVGEAIGHIIAAFKMGGLRAAAGVALGYARQLMDGLLNWIGQMTPKVLAQLGQWAGAFWQWVKTAGPPLLLELAKLSGQLIGWIIAQAITIGQKFVDEWVPRFIAWATHVWPKLGPALWDIITSIVNWIKDDAGPTLLSAAGNLGGALADGIKAGLGNKLNDVKNAVGGFFGGIIQHAKDAVGVKSPSTVFQKIGEDMMAGLVKGIDASGPAVADAVGRHLIRAHMVAAHMVAGHYTRSGRWVAPHMVAAHMVAAHYARTGRRAYHAVPTGGILGSGGSNLPVAYNYNPATGTSGGPIAAGSTGAAALAASLPGLANYGGGGQTVINVTVAAGAVTATGSSLTGRAVGQTIGTAIAQALDALAQSQLLTAPGAQPLLPGAMG
jgi:TP901 family phage tail tape measure protein